MKHNMIFTIPAIAALLMSFASCSDDEPVREDRDLANSDVYLDTAEGMSQNIYYKPYVGYVGDPMPFYDPVSGDFKIMYLQDYRPNQAVTYHPIWGVSTKDGASVARRAHSMRSGHGTRCRPRHRLNHL